MVWAGKFDGLSEGWPYTLLLPRVPTNSLCVGGTYLKLPSLFTILLWLLVGSMLRSSNMLGLELITSVGVKAQGPLRCDLHKVVVTSNDD